MKRIFVWMLFALVFVGAREASAATFYICGSTAAPCNGSDANNGTSKTTAWLHAPGMTGCTGVCASTTPAAGDKFIFRGGDTWHYGDSAAIPYVGGTSPQWNWNWAGSAGNCQLDASAGAVTKTSCIYVGVDSTWFSGVAWSRPIMSGDNAKTTSYVTTCTHDEVDHNFMFVNQPYVIVDNFEWTNWCWASNAGAVLTFLSSAGEVTNNYFHGWSTSAAATDQFRMVTCNGTGCAKSSFILVDHNVFDGSDASLGATAGKATGFALGAGYEIASNVFWHLSNVYIGGAAPSIHDNTMYYLIEPSDGQGDPLKATHGNLFEQQGSNACSTYFYNNLQYVVGEGEGNDLYSAPGCDVYIFNNISFLYRPTFSGSTPTNSNDGSNCFLPENTGGSGARTWSIFNNTLDSPCSFSQKNITLTQDFENNHLIGFTSVTGLANPTIDDNGSELFQTEAVANAEGYAPTNFYAPTPGGSTINKGANLTSSICNTMTYGPAADACKRGHGGVTYDQTTHVAVDNAAPPRPVTGTWDVGAYEYTVAIADAGSGADASLGSDASASTDGGATTNRGDASNGDDGAAGSSGGCGCRAINGSSKDDAIVWCATVLALGLVLRKRRKVRANLTE